ncbi:MAG TPA: chemotaxis-specific protein-glutamate methyltransferase CheB, partial [bacterium]|nr:chemotaxis-specific protein-glutamate methyltransferase CheB [bacterium]
MVRVLLAEDSSTTRQMLVSLLLEDPEIQVVGEAKNGLEAVDMARNLRPDVIAMDIVMPEMDGFEATKSIMTHIPTPIVIISNVVNVREIQVSLQALKAGALTVIKKPGGLGGGENDTDRSIFVSTLKIMSQVKLVRLWSDTAKEPKARPRRAFPKAFPDGKKGRVVVIAASTGGPAALNRIFSELGGNFSAPILVVQHMAPGFITGCASWMNGNSSLRVKVGEEGESPDPGTVYLAGDNRHLGVSALPALAYTNTAPIGSFRPSGTCLFESAAKVYGSSTIAVVLTGMGSDGVAGLKAVKDAGGLVVAQDEDSSIVFGMPGEAIKSGYTDMIVPLP